MTGSLTLTTTLRSGEAVCVRGGFTLTVLGIEDGAVRFGVEESADAGADYEDLYVRIARELGAG